MHIIVKLPLLSLTVYPEYIYFKFPEQQSIRSRVCIIEIGYYQIAFHRAYTDEHSPTHGSACFPTHYFALCVAKFMDHYTINR